MTRALVTGARGFLGVALVDAARRAGLTVTQTDVRGEQGLDLLDTDAVCTLLGAAQPNVLFHCAGLTRAEPQRLLQANVVATASLLTALRAAAPSCRLVLVSSSAVYAPTSEKVTESHALEPVAPYGLSKLAQELLALEEARRGRLDVVVARAFNVVGPGMPDTLAAGAFAAHVLAAEENHGPKEFTVEDTSAIRDFIDVRDVATGLLAVAEHGQRGEAYNLCRGVGRPVHDCLMTLVGLGHVRTTPHVKVRGPGDNPAQVGDGSKLAALCSWRADLALETSMNDMLSAMRARQGDKEKTR